MDPRTQLKFSESHIVNIYSLPKVQIGVVKPELMLSGVWKWAIDAELSLDIGGS